MQPAEERLPWCMHMRRTLRAPAEKITDKPRKQLQASY